MTLHAALQNNKNFASKFCMLFPDGAISLFDLLEKRGEFVIISVRATMRGTHQSCRARHFRSLLEHNIYHLDSIA